MKYNSSNYKSNKSSNGIVEDNEDDSKQLPLNNGNQTSIQKHENNNNMVVFKTDKKNENNSNTNDKSALIVSDEGSIINDDINNNNNKSVNKKKRSLELDNDEENIFEPPSKQETIVHNKKTLQQVWRANLDIRGVVEKCTCNDLWNNNLIIISFPDAFMSGWCSVVLEPGYQYLIQNVTLKFLDNDKQTYTTNKYFQSKPETKYHKLERKENLILNKPEILHPPYVDLTCHITSIIQNDEKLIKFTNGSYDTFTKWKNSGDNSFDNIEINKKVILRDVKKTLSTGTYFTVNGRVIIINNEIYDKLNLPLNEIKYLKKVKPVSCNPPIFSLTFKDNLILKCEGCILAKMVVGGDSLDGPNLYSEILKEIQANLGQLMVTVAIGGDGQIQQISRMG